MNRRDFLLLSGAAAASYFIQFIPWVGKAQNQAVELAAGGVLYRGTAGGEIHTSLDGGRSWQLHTRLGSQYTVTGLFLDSSQRVHASAAFGGRSFELMLTRDKKYWLTA